MNEQTDQLEASKVETILSRHYHYFFICILI